MSRRHVTDHPLYAVRNHILERRHRVMPGMGTAIERRWRVFPIRSLFLPVEDTLRTFSVTTGSSLTKLLGTAQHACRFETPHHVLRTAARHWRVMTTTEKYKSRQQHTCYVNLGM